MKRLLVLAVLLAGCPAPTPRPTSDDCAAACDNGTRLECVWALPTPNGASCLEVCASSLDLLPWNTSCLARAATCAEAGDCPR